MLNRLLIITLLSSVFPLFSFSHELPPIISFSPETYNADNQNWSITQTDNKHIFIANNKGLLEFNGDSWQLYPTPNESIIRSVHAHNNLIYSGSFRDFGFWERDGFGRLNYTSLVETSELELSDNEEFWTILSYSNWILFQSLDAIYIFNTLEGEIKRIQSDYGITKLMKINGDIYFSKPLKGIYKIQDGSSYLISDHEVFRNNLVLNIFEIDDELLVQTNTSGIFYLTDNPSPWGGDNVPLFQSLTVYNAIQIQSGDIILGTISDGVIKVNSKGEIVYHITKRESLINNTVLSIFEDYSGNIWLGLDNGINCINQNSPLSIFYDNNGELGTVYTSIVFNGNLYVGTNQGLFFKPWEVGTNDRFQLVEGSTGQVWDLFYYQGELFCGHNDGGFKVRDQQLIEIFRLSGTWTFKNIPNRPDLLLVGNYNGLNILVNDGDQWSWRNSLPGFNISSRYIEFIDEETVLISHEYKGVFRVTFDEDFSKINGVEKIQSVDKGLYSSLVSFKGEILYGNEKGIWKYNVEGQEFIKDEFLSSFYNPSTYSSGKLISTGGGRELWIFSKGSIYYLAPAKITGEIELTSIPIHYSVRNAMVGYENIYQLNGNRYLFGNAQGFFIIHLNKVKNRKERTDLNIFKILARSLKKAEEKLLKLEEIAIIPANYDHLEFYFSMPEFENIFTAEYKYQLIGLMDDWSNWQTENKVVFSNLKFGTYEFRVQGRIGENSNSDIVAFSFVIDPPFLLSRKMVFIYFLLIITIIVLIHSAYKLYFKKQKMRLQQESQRELDYQESENKRKLMRLNNEKLQQDIESKNRELAISTMSLIKKNKVLNTIKSELNKFEDDPRQIKKVMGLINKNLKSSSDWEFFEKAFNNADRDFFKKIKANHPVLTPDDLRLCAYLRLNLSSKEIAPLLGISPKSVEIKRYRLRKKMDLPSEANLTEYILEI